MSEWIRERVNLREWTTECVSETADGKNDLEIHTDVYSVFHVETFAQLLLGLQPFFWAPSSPSWWLSVCENKALKICLFPVSQPLHVFTQIIPVQKFFCALPTPNKYKAHMKHTFFEKKKSKKFSFTFLPTLFFLTITGYKEFFLGLTAIFLNDRHLMPRDYSVSMPLLHLMDPIPWFLSAAW